MVRTGTHPGSGSVQSPAVAAERRPTTDQATVTVEGAYDGLTATGIAVELRPYAPEDAPAVLQLLESASDRSSYYRFFSTSQLAAADYVRRLGDPTLTTSAVVVVDRDRIVAVGSLHPGAEEAVRAALEAELGVLVADDRQGDGLGTLIVEDLLARALLSGVSQVVAVVMPTNSAMLDVFKNSGFAVSQHFSNGEVQVTLDVASAQRTLRRVADRQARAAVASLDHVLRPQSVAVVGAGKHRHTVGRQVLDHLVRSGYPGRLFAVNPDALQIGSVPGYASVRDIGQPVDLVVLAVPSESVPIVAQDCAASGVRALLTLTAGFGEAGGSASQSALLRLCRSAGMRLVGPNCIGVANTEPSVRLDATFLPEGLPVGATAVLSQSGAAAVAMLDAFQHRGAGVSSLVTVGNKADIGGNDVLPWWETDERTRVIAAYLESIAEPRPFARLAGRVSRAKPIVLLKAGRTAAAAAAASSHTAAAADDDAAVDALCRAANIVRVDDLRQLADVSALAGMQPLPRGPRVAIVGNSGGPAVLAADACSRLGLVVAQVGPESQRELQALLPPSAAVAGPIDVTAGASPAQLEQAMQIAASDPAVDVVIAVLTVLGHVPGAELTASLDRVSADHAEIPVAACVFGNGDAAWQCGVPRFDQPEDAVLAVAKLHRYVQRRPSARAIETQLESPPDLDLGDVRDIVRGALAGNGESWLPAADAYRVLRSCGVEVAPFVAADDAATAAEGCEVLAFPVVVKADGPDLVHKSDVGGVRLNLATSAAVRAAVHEMEATLGDRLRGVIVQTQAGQGTEIIVGATRDPRFGPMVLVGRGGVDSDVDPDRCWGLAPLSTGDAVEMLTDLRSRAGFAARRGHPAVDLDRLADVVSRVSHLMATVPEIGEIDLNPVLAGAATALVVDVRIRVRRAPAPSLRDHVRHLR
jgi:acyl-CoA synthetase (NDP forming)/L-amino acid N-acyltransferase YncA